jgi:hypothetical protein
VGVEQEQTAAAVRPVQNVLADAVFEEFGFADAGRMTGRLLPMMSPSWRGLPGMNSI